MESPVLADDLLYEVALKFDVATLKLMSPTNKFLNNLWHDTSFWRKKYLQDFGEVPDIDPLLLSLFHPTYGTLHIIKYKPRTEEEFEEGKQIEIESRSHIDSHAFRKCLICEQSTSCSIMLLDYHHNLYQLDINEKEHKFVMSGVRDVSKNYILCWDGNLYNRETLVKCAIDFKVLKLTENYLIDTENYPRFEDEAWSKLEYQARDEYLDYFIDFDYYPSWWSVEKDRKSIYDRKSKKFLENACIDPDGKLVFEESWTNEDIHTNMVIRDIQSKPGTQGLNHPVQVIDQDYNFIEFDISGDDPKIDIIDRYVTCISRSDNYTAYISMVNFIFE